MVMDDEVPEHVGSGTTDAGVGSGTLTNSTPFKNTSLFAPETSSFFNSEKQYDEKQPK